MPTTAVEVDLDEKYRVARAELDAAYEDWRLADEALGLAEERLGWARKAHDDARELLTKRAVEGAISGVA